MKSNKQLDEMQESKLLKIQEKGFWLVFGFCLPRFLFKHINISGRNWMMLRKKGRDDHVL